MARWEANARGRLERAALELYTSQGFERTTVVEIAERAGLTKRTFFRHFADKREILFSGGAEMAQLYRTTIAARPHDAPPFSLVASALEAGAEMIQSTGERGRRRQALVVANPELLERELLKTTDLATAISAALREHGVPADDADLMSQTGMAAFRTAYTTWTSQPELSDLPTLVRSAMKRLKDLAAHG